MDNIQGKVILKEHIDNAFHMLYSRDRHLIYNGAISDNGKDDKHHVGERAIVFRYAHYLQNLINEDPWLKKYDLDCEYNRNGVECKSLPSFPNGTYPDLIIHKRGSNDKNILVMEFKTYWNSNVKDDMKKIEEFTDTNGKYRFKYGVSVLVNIDAPKLKWFGNEKNSGTL